MPGRCAPVPRPPSRNLLFLDLETTGLAGGAGTQAFLVGLAILEDEAIHVRQYLLPGFEHERALLAEVGAWVADHETLVTFNGRSFDVPLIETRYLFHRLAFPLADRPHVDMLHPSRRLWKERPSIAGPPLDDDSCKLSVLERHLAGLHRVGDVPGFEIPSRFFRFVRDGDAHAARGGARAQPHRSAVARARHGARDPADRRWATRRRRIRASASASAASTSVPGGPTRPRRRSPTPPSLAARIGREPDVRAESLKRLALCRRRSGRLPEAAAAWQELVALPACPATLRREAREALAIHHEHRSRDLDAARTFVVDALSEHPGPRWREQAEYRLRRLDRKLSTRHPGLLFQRS